MYFKHSSFFVVLLALVLFAGACGSPLLTTTVDVTGGHQRHPVYRFWCGPAGRRRWRAPGPVGWGDGNGRFHSDRTRLHRHDGVW